MDRRRTATSANTAVITAAAVPSYQGSTTTTSGASPASSRSVATVERLEARGVHHRGVQVSGRLQRAREHRAERHHRGSVAATDHLEPAGCHVVGFVVRRQARAHVGGLAVRHHRPKQLVHLTSVTRHQHLHARDREHQRRVRRRMMGRAFAGVVVGAARAHEGPAEALIAEVEFQLLVGALGHERRQRMRDRMEPLHGEPGRDAHHRCTFPGTSPTARRTSGIDTAMSPSGATESSPRRAPNVSSLNMESIRAGQPLRRSTLLTGTTGRPGSLVRDRTSTRS